MATTKDSAPADLLEDWLTIWQSECAALWADREVHEAMQRAVDGWASQTRLTLAAMQACHDAGRQAAGLTWSVPPPRPPPAPDAPDGRDDMVRQLLARVAELERRLPPDPAKP